MLWTAGSVLEKAFTLLRKPLEGWPLWIHVVGGSLQGALGRGRAENTAGVGPAGLGACSRRPRPRCEAGPAAAGAAIWWRHQEAPGGGLEALGEGVPSAGAGGGRDACPCPAPLPAPPGLLLRVCTPRCGSHCPGRRASPASASVIGPEPSSAAQGPCLSWVRLGASDEPPPPPPEPCMGATDGVVVFASSCLPQVLLRTYCASGHAVLALAGLPSQRGPARGGGGGGAGGDQKHHR